MATYQYKCNVCGGQMEVQRLMTDAENAPICCNEVTTRMWNAAPIHFKAGGFYSTGG